MLEVLPSFAVVAVRGDPLMVLDRCQILQHKPLRMANKGMQDANIHRGTRWSAAPSEEQLRNGVEVQRCTLEVMYRCHPSKPPTPSASGTVSTAADVSIIVAHTMNDALSCLAFITSHDNVLAASLDWTTYHPCAKCSQNAYTNAISVSAHGLMLLSARLARTLAKGTLNHQFGRRTYQKEQESFIVAMTNAIVHPGAMVVLSLIHI